VGEVGAVGPVEWRRVFHPSHSLRLLEVALSDSALLTGWMDLLRPQGYDCFLTMTFDPRLGSGAARSPDSALWKAKTFLTRYFEGRRERVKAFIVAEPFELGNYHVHGLVDSHGSAELRFHLWRAAKGRHGRARFEPFESGESVRAYVCKYLLKESTNWEILGAVSPRTKTV
jgi:hypothetical protein